MWGGCVKNYYVQLSERVSAQKCGRGEQEQEEYMWFIWCLKGWMKLKSIKPGLAEVELWRDILAIDGLQHSLCITSE